MTKDEILATFNQTRVEFLKAIEGLSEDALVEPGVLGEWSVKDIMAHISMWEAELVKMLWELRQGNKPSRVDLVNGKSVDQINEEWHQEQKDRPLERIFADFHAVRTQTIRQIQGFTDRELSEPRHYPWLKGHALEAWIAGDGFDHEAEHTAEIKSWRAGTS